MKKKLPLLIVGVMFILFAYTILTFPVKTPPDYTPPPIPHTIRKVGVFVNYPAILAGFWVMTKTDSTSMSSVAATFFICFSAWGSLVYFALKKGIALTSDWTHISGSQ